MVLVPREPEPTITGHHAHVYYDGQTRPVAAQLRDAIAARFEVDLGR
jgi:aromatic ring-cleaving dioxygenase